MKTENFNNRNSKLSHKDNVKMSISDEGTQYLMANLTNLYSQPDIAVLREYTANALDSHIKAGQTKPILVNIVLGEKTVSFQPSYTVKQPYTLTVEDFGVGLDKDDIVNIYSQYGASTKRGTNTQVGAFGLGAKSGLAVADEFKLVARKKGVELHCRIVKDDDGVGVIEFIKTVPTVKPDGVKVVLNVEEGQTDLLKVAKSFFKTWKTGSVLLNGETPQHITEDAGWLKIAVNDDEMLGWVEVNNDWKKSSGRFFSTNSGGVVSVGGICYKIDSADRETFNQTIPEFSHLFNLTILTLPVGSVDLTPSREGLRYTSKTVAAIKNGYNAYVDLLQETLTFHIDSLTPEKAVKFFFQNRELISLAFNVPLLQTFNTVKYRGTSFNEIVWLTETDSQGKEQPVLNSSNEPIFYQMIYPKTTGLKTVNMEDAVSVEKIFTTDSINGNYSLFRKIVLTANDLTETWFKRNIRDYGKSLTDDTFCVIATNDDVNSNVWIDAVAPVVDKETMLAGAKAFRASKTRKTGVKRETQYSVYLRKTGNITNQNVETLNQYRLAYIERDDKLVGDNLWKELSSVARTSTKSFNGLSKTFYSEFFNVWNNFFPEFDGFIFLDKSSKMLVSKLPSVVSYKEILHSYHNSLPHKEQLYVEYYIQLGFAYSFLPNLKAQCKMLVKKNLVKNITDFNFRQMVQDFGSLTQTKDDLYLYLALNRKNNYKDTPKVAKADIKDYAPYILTPLANPEQLVKYLNVIIFEDENAETVNVNNLDC